MDNKIVSTTYVPLQPPYQIIKYSDDIAMQIGTLIVTIQKEGNVNGLGYEIETHSHPVVTYENKFKTKPNQQLTSYQFLEGAVWNFVEVKDVTTICLSNSRLPWKEFIDFLWRDVERMTCVAQPTISAFWSLDKLCGGVELPKPGDYVVHLEQYNYDKIEGKNIPVLRSRPDDVFAIHLELNDDYFTVFTHQFLSYLIIMTAKRQTNKPVSVAFETDDESLRPIVRTLNGISFTGDKAKDVDRDTLLEMFRRLEAFKNNGFNVLKD